MPVWPRCGRENPDDARFCASCGTSLAPEVRREERKVVSVLFAGAYIREGEALLAASA
jgi:hypothetical protein